MCNFSRRTFLLGIVLLTGSGCAMLSSGSQDMQISFGQQQTELERLVPKETHREEAIKQLEKNGITGSFGVSNTVYYCDTWSREDGTVWPLSIALLFDEEGKLYDYSKEAVPVLD